MLSQMTFGCFGKQGEKNGKNFRRNKKETLEVFKETLLLSDVKLYYKTIAVTSFKSCGFFT